MSSILHFGHQNLILVYDYVDDHLACHQQWSSCMLGVLFLIVLARKNVSSKKFPTDRGIYALDQKIPSCSRNIYSRSKNPRLIEEYMLSSKKSPTARNQNDRTNILEILTGSTNFEWPGTKCYFLNGSILDRS